MIYEFNHYGIVVKDLKASLAFYQGLCGARIVYKGFIPPSKTDVIYLQIAGGMIELLAPAEPPSTEKFGVTHLAFLSDDLDADYARLLAKGYAGLVAPKVAGSGVGRLAFLGDPNGARVELIQRDLKMREGLLDHPVIRSFRHYSLVADDLEKAVRFYRDDLGMTELKRVDALEDGVATIYLGLGDDVLQLRQGSAAETTATMYDHIALGVDDADAAPRWFAERGVTAAPAISGESHGDVGSTAMIRDPDGVRIALVQRPI